MAGVISGHQPLFWGTRCAKSSADSGPYTRGDRGRLLAGALLAIGVAGSEIGTVIVFDFITNHVLATGHLAGFWSLAAAWLAVAAGGAAAMSG
ncbi:MAG TPA: hypothetical protein VHW06_13445 [Streptosporangiaceae bacterium]|nr:hypothetical protein [Streptosporangiaceae bacterium]